MADDDERNDDGLPLDPTARRAAVESQFDDYRAREAGLTEDDSMAGDARDTTEDDALAISDDDCLRAMLAKQLLRVGIQADSIRSLFQAIDRSTAPNAKPWSWLDSRESREQVACLVLLVSRGAAYLTTYERAKRWLGDRTALVIDVASFIREIEDRTGRPFQIAKPILH